MYSIVFPSKAVANLKYLETIVANQNSVYKTNQEHVKFRPYISESSVFTSKASCFYLIFCITVKLGLPFKGNTVRCSELSSGLYCRVK
jgi:hypothetical protein